MDINKDLLYLVTTAGSLVAMSFLSTKDKMNRNDAILKESIKIKHTTEDLLEKILSLIKNPDPTNPNKELEETNKFWDKIDEIGFLSKKNLIDKAVIVDLFKILQDPKLNVIESIYIRNIHNRNIADFAKKLKLEAQNIEKITDIPIKLRGQFVKRTYPNIWNFTRTYYENPFMNFCMSLCNGSRKLFVTISDILMLKPIFSSFVIFIFMVGLTKLTSCDWFLRKFT